MLYLKSIIIKISNDINIIFVAPISEEYCAYEFSVIFLLSYIVASDTVNFYQRPSGQLQGFPVFTEFWFILFS
jgi:hypothetical protein